MTCTTLSATALLGTCTIKGSVKGRPLYLKMFRTASSFRALAPSPYTVSAPQKQEFHASFAKLQADSYPLEMRRTSRLGAILRLARYLLNQLEILLPLSKLVSSNSLILRVLSAQEVSC